MSASEDAANDSFESAREEVSSPIKDEAPYPAKFFTTIDQNILRAHSFQLVKITNDMHALHAQHDTASRTTSRHGAAVADLCLSVAELKGAVARLTMEVHMLQDATLATLLTRRGMDDLVDRVAGEHRESLTRALRDAAVRRIEKHVRQTDAAAPETPPQEAVAGPQVPLEEVASLVREMNLEGSGNVDVESLVREMNLESAGGVDAVGGQIGNMGI